MNRIQRKKVGCHFWNWVKRDTDFCFVSLSVSVLCSHPSHLLALMNQAAIFWVTLWRYPSGKNLSYCSLLPKASKKLKKPTTTFHKVLNPLTYHVNEFGSGSFPSWALRCQYPSQTLDYNLQSSKRTWGREPRVPWSK